MQPPGEQAAVCGGIQAAQGILIALFQRDAGGLGQRIEVSQQEAMALSQETAMQMWDMRHELRKRQGGSTRMLPGLGTYECADGHVYSMVGVAGFGAPLSVLLAWMNEEGEGHGLDDDSVELLSKINLRELTALLTKPEELQKNHGQARTGGRGGGVEVLPHPLQARPVCGWPDAPAADWSGELGEGHS